MFGKKPPSKDALSDRVRAIAAREPTPRGKVQQPRAPRESAYKNATVLLDSGSRFSVAIKDISASGARIEFFQDLPLEGVFTLIEPMLKIRRRARVSWRRGGAAGLAFLD
jgi:hypothetical protein